VRVISDYLIAESYKPDSRWPIQADSWIDDGPAAARTMITKSITIAAALDGIVDADKISPRQ
jgi:hypothetical protein